eukprot:CAMPEP_0185331092 /NCGR_PEP_ID=MMETSP1363-20130426/78536_1 /TAXON_ID=38817 /ORGANISM="Gephyrocapsa oceanica, Strain RCC1303" /LENGTH=52 /DNA_ID=CAMNT_0027929959 /DNA_START=91 /DNA_END=245 /DNA_ORIENTATION=+
MASFFAAVAREPAAPTRCDFALTVFLAPAAEVPLCFLLSDFASRVWSRQPSP